MATLASWKNNATIALVGRLPLQSYASAFALVEAYLSNVGGWVPESVSDPTGVGEPANGATEIEAAEDIASDQFDNIYDMDVTVPVVLSMKFPRKLNDSLTTEQALAAIQPLLENWLGDRLASTAFPVRLESVGTATGTIDGTGTQTAANRVGIQSEITATTKLVDPRAIAVKFARETYDLDDTWNASTVYIEDNQPFVVIVEKYADTTYVALDEASAQRYVIEVNTNSYSVTTGTSVSTAS